MFESEISPQIQGCMCDSVVDDMPEKLDEFKNQVLDDIIQCGVYTDGYDYYSDIGRPTTISVSSN